MSVLVDTSVWVDYFRGAEDADEVDRLIEENIVATNDLILAELIPALLLRGERKLAALLREVRRYPITVDWEGIIEMQTVCLRKGINGVGIPDLIIAQNAMQHRLALLAGDRHFVLLARHVPLAIYER